MNDQTSVIVLKSMFKVRRRYLKVVTSSPLCPFMLESVDVGDIMRPKLVFGDKKGEISMVTKR